MVNGLWLIDGIRKPTGGNRWALLDQSLTYSPNVNKLLRIQQHMAQIRPHRWG